jgi:5-methylthioadenosine/S-adenosylhomocysteine deaminase
MSKKIIKAAYLLLENDLKKDWGIEIERNKIVRVCPNKELDKNINEVYDFSDRLIAPGFINNHMHMYGVLSHGIITDALVSNFSSFLEDFWWPYVENRLDHKLVEITTKWACVEMIKSGITTFVDILEGPNSIPGALDIEANVIKNAGMRGILSFEACERQSKKNGQLGLDENANFINKYKGKDELIEGMMSVHTLFTASKEYLKQAKNMADNLNCDIHMHLSESNYEPEWAIDKYGKRPVEVYEEIGFLGSNVMASQGVQLNENELDILAKNGVRLVHMPVSNCEVGGGIAPVPEMLDKGIKVGLGTDGYVNNFFEVMRDAFLIHKANKEDPMIIPAEKVYSMATNSGARVLGKENIGKIAVNCLADIIAIKINTPTPIFPKNVYDQIILFRNPEDVTDVMINGEFVMKDSKLLTIDEAKTKEELRKVAAKFWNQEV